MSQEQQQLRFSVEESVWFQKGQEVSELLSIALDPDITIHEHEQYISIRGALQLTGEYKIDNDVKTEDQFEYTNVRYVNDVQTGEDGISVLQHRFPVDITIPNDRIENLEEVYVSIDSFDYELPELKCLKLIADLSISGISKESSAPESTQARIEEEEVLEPLYRGSQSEEVVNDNDRGSNESVHPFSSFYQEAESTVEDVDKLSPANNQVDRLEKEVQEELVHEGAGKIEDQPTVPSLEEEVNEQVEQEEELYDPFIVEVRKQEQEEDVPQEVQYSFFSKAEATSTDEQGVEEEAVEREESDPKDAHYLTSLFARDDDEDFSRVKMCIVQQGDTVELICERYDISVQQLLRVNDFHADQDVYEGQILYIPAYSISK